MSSTPEDERNFEVLYVLGPKGKRKERKREGFAQLQDALSFAASRPKGTTSVWARYGTLWKPIDIDIPLLKKPPRPKRRKT